MYSKNLRGGEAFKEARARAQYYQFQDQVQDALNGVPGQGRSVGVYRGERRLRTLMGLPTSDGRLIRPQDEPPIARHIFGWDEVLGEALVRRVELRRQMWEIKRRELEVTAARNFTLPRLDTVATYRLRGFGNDLTGDAPGPGTPETLAERTQFGSAFKDLGTWDHQEWEAGLQLTIPLGYRQGWASVRHAQLRVARERAILKEQERQIALGLSDAVSETSRAHAAVRAGFNRLMAAGQDLKATTAAYEADQVTVELLLDSQQRLADAQSRYYRSLADYAVSLKNVHREKGSMLEYNGVFLGEGPWPRKAYRDAWELTRRLREKKGGVWAIKPAVVSRGPLSQRFQPLETTVIEHLETLEPLEAVEEEELIPNAELLPEGQP